MPIKLAVLLVMLGVAALLATDGTGAAPRQTPATRWYWTPTACE